MLVEQLPPLWVCLFVDLSGSFVAGQWRQSTDRIRLGMDLKFAYNAEEAMDYIYKLPVAVLVIATSSNGKDLGVVLRGFQHMVGCFTDFQAIVTDDPTPQDLSNYYEYGIDKVFNKQDWQEDVKRLILDTVVALNDPECLEAKALIITSQIKNSRNIDVAAAEAHLGQEDVDHRSAFTRGSLRERAGDYDGATVAFSKSRQLNRRFLPASSKLAETFLILGRVDEAIEIFEELESVNPNHAERKATLATAHMAKGNTAKAQQLMNEAAALNPDNAQLIVAQGIAALDKKEYKLAMRLLSGQRNLGTYIVQKLNNVGIELARGNRIEDALQLYEMTIQIVEPNLRYKIDMNAALACYKAGQFQAALEFLEKCEKDYGGSFDKLERVRKNVLEAQKKTV